MSNRIIRGFARLGIGAAVLTAIYGVALTGVATLSEYNDNSPGILIYDSATHQMSKTRPSGANIYEQIDTPPPSLNELVRHRTPALYAAKTAGICLSITVLAALAVFGLFRGLGWMIAGFALTLASVGSEQTRLVPRPIANQRAQCPSRAAPRAISFCSAPICELGQRPDHWVALEFNSLRQF